MKFLAEFDHQIISLNEWNYRIWIENCTKEHGYVEGVPDTKSKY